MTDLALQVRLSAVDGGLVGQLRLTRQEIDELTQAQAPAAAAATRVAEAATRSAQATGQAAGEARELAAGSKTLAAAQTEVMRAMGGTSAGADELARSNSQASATERVLASDVARLRAELDPAGEAQRRLARDTDIANTALREGAITQEQHAVAIQRATAASRGELASIGQRRAGYQQLGYQVGDVSQQLALGINPAVVFGQQIGQVTQAVQLLSGRTTGFIGFLAGPYGAVLTGAITAAALFGATLFEAGDAMEKVTFSTDGLGSAQGILGQVMDLTTGKIISQREELVALGIAQARVAQIQAEARAQELRGKIGELGAPRFRIDGGMGGGLNIGYDDGDPLLRNVGRRALDGGDPVAAIDNLDMLRAAGRLTSEEFAQAAADVASLNTELGNVRISEAAERLLRGVGTGADRRLLFRPQRSRKPKKPADPAILENFGEDAEDRIAKIGASFSDTPPQIERVNSALAQLDGIMRDVERRRPPNLEQLRADAAAARPLIEQGINQPFEEFVQRQEEALAIGDLLAGGREDEAAAMRIILQLERQMGPLGAERRGVVLETVQGLREQERATERLRESQGTYLRALDDTRAIVRDTLFDIRNIADAPDRLLAAFENVRADQLMERYFGETFRELEDQITGAGKAEDAADRLAKSIDRVTVSVARLGDAADSAASGVASTQQQDQAEREYVVTGQRDPRNFFANTITKLAGNLLGEDTARAIGDAAGKGLGGAATGSIVAGVGNLLGIKTSSTGARLGGAAGAFLPIPGGEIIGSIVGGLVGNLFGGSAKTGSATISSIDGDVGTSGSSRTLKKAAETAASGVQSSLARIVDALGGSAGNFSVSTGFIEGKKLPYRVDPTGRGRVEGSGVLTFASEAEAAAAALLDAIKDGAVGGLSAAVSSALRSSSDVEAAVAEALKVNDIETLIGGPEAALRQSFKAFERDAAERERIARKYGLDLVKLEQITGEQRAQVFEDALEARVGSLRELLTDLTSGDLFEGSLADRRTAIQGEIAKATADADAGVADAADRVAQLNRQLLEVTREGFGTAGPEFATDRDSARSAAERLIAQETERVKAAQDAARGTNEKLDRSNALAADASVQRDAQLSELRAITASISALGGTASAGGGVSRVVALR